MTQPPVIDVSDRRGEGDRRRKPQVGTCERRKRYPRTAALVVGVSRCRLR